VSLVTNALRETEAGSEAIRRLTRRVVAEYSEMPGLSITMPQAQRLMGADPNVCVVVMKTLVSRGFLKRTSRGTYIRASA
jgi:hypothetical protein